MTTTTTVVMSRNRLWVLLLLFSVTYSDGASNSTISFLSTTAEASHRTHRGLAVGDYAEIPGTCPAKTTCPVICSADESLCPTKCDDGLNLCADGSCSADECDETLESPCECGELWFACAKVIDFYDNCYPSYQEIYDAYEECLDYEEEALPYVSYTAVGYLFCYIWYSAVTLLVFVWCFYNHRVSPVKDSAKTLNPVSFSVSSNSAENDEWIQTGYRRHVLGSILYFCVIISLVGVQFLLFLLTIFYYMQQYAIVRWEPVFYHEPQVFLTFQIVWMIGIVWSMAFKWPQSIYSLFLRRCTLDQATHVAVRAPTKTVDSISTTERKYGESFIRALWCPFDALLHGFFSYPRTPVGFETILCKVDMNTRSFYCRMGRYVLDEYGDMFIPGSKDVGKTMGELIDQRSGLSTEETQAMLYRVGPNIISIAKPTLIGCFVKEFSHPFYLYQNFIIWTWFIYWYYHMALIASFVRLVAGIVVGVFQYQSDLVLYKLSQVEGEAEVIRDGKPTLISAVNIVPGDVMVLKHGMVFCDLVVIDSEHLLVDESVITGESTPIAKSKLEAPQRDTEYNETKHKHHTIYAGSNIIECGEGTLGLVVATSSFTKKGQLLSDILSYQRHRFQFDDELKLVLLILLTEAIVLVTLVFQFLGKELFVYAWFYATYVMATVLPPLLATVFVVSVGISANRLHKRKISCTYSQGILVAGKVNLCCFDKTGTLTKPNMTAVGVEVEGDDELRKKALIGMAVCHNLKVLQNGAIVGNEVDRASFQFTNATIDFSKVGDVEVHHMGNKYAILKQYTFDNHTATQSVIITTEDGKKRIFVKGSPEAIRTLCWQETIPKSFEETLRSCSQSGMYQLAIAYREYDLGKDVSSVTREEIETSLSFCGVIKFQNELKLETKSVMKDLQDGNILTTMITGDNVNTGIRVAREAGLCLSQSTILGHVGMSSKVEWIDVDTNEILEKPTVLSGNVDFALTGEAWLKLLSEDPDYAKTIAKYVRVFGRCNPLDKVSVVSTLVQLGYITLMCGDGQNDCGALKTAHIGIALSSSDASVVAPFTSLDKTVTSVTEVLREGRCALSSALKVYSFYMMYGQIVSIMQVINTYFVIEFSDWAWIFLDGIWSLSLSFTLPLAHAAKTLTPCRPTASLFGPRTMFSICGMFSWNMLFMVISLKALFNQDWFQCRMWESEELTGDAGNSDNYESAVVIIIGGFQIIGTAIALNFGYTWRAPWMQNYLFVVFATTWTICHFIMTLYPSNFSCIWRVNCDDETAVRLFFYPEPVPIGNPYHTTVMPIEFRRELVVIMIANLFALCTWEYFFVNGFLYKNFSFGEDASLYSAFDSIQDDLNDGVCDRKEIEDDTASKGRCVQVLSPLTPSSTNTSAASIEVMLEEG